MTSFVNLTLTYYCNAKITGLVFRWFRIWKSITQGCPIFIIEICRKLIVLPSAFML
jgi:hypothetical protein